MFLYSSYVCTVFVCSRTLMCLVLGGDYFFRFLLRIESQISRRWWNLLNLFDIFLARIASPSVESVSQHRSVTGT